jgi:hypothetical protein
MSDLKRRFGFGNLTGEILPRSCSPFFFFAIYPNTKSIFIQTVKSFPLCFKVPCPVFLWREQDRVWKPLDAIFAKSCCFESHPGLISRVPTSKRATATIHLVLTKASSKSVKSIRYQCQLQMNNWCLSWRWLMYSEMSPLNMNDGVFSDTSVGDMSNRLISTTIYINVLSLISGSCLHHHTFQRSEQHPEPYDNHEPST